MRWTVALVPLLMLSGCLSGGQATDNDADRADGDEPTVQGLREGVVFYNEPYKAVPNEPLEFMVQVPEGATNVKVEMSASGAATPMDEAVVTLSACGQGRVSWNPGPNVVVSISVLGGSWREAELCERAEGGRRLITVDTGVTPMTGRILLRADLPPA